MKEYYIEYVGRFMIKSWICYIAVVILVLVYAIMYHHLSGFVIWAMVTVIPLLYLFITLLIANKGLEVICKEGDVTVTKGETKEIPVRIKTRSKFEVGSSITIEIEEYLGLGDVSSKKIIKGRLTSDDCIFNIPYTAKYSGINEIIINKIEHYSAFSLFKHSIAVDKKISFLILPSYHEYDIAMEFSTDEIEGEGVDGKEKYSDHLVGSDPSELFDIRDYRPGDRMTGIHWKISAKKNKLMVKDLGYSLLCDNAIFFDVSYIDNREEAEKAVTMLFYLVSRYLEKDKAIYIVWCIENNQRIYRAHISDNTDIYELFMRIFKSYQGAYKNRGLVKHKLGLCELYKREYNNDYLNYGIYVHSGNSKADPVYLGDMLNTEVVRCIQI